MKPVGGASLQSQMEEEQAVTCCLFTNTLYPTK